MKVLTSVNIAYPDEFYRALHGFNRRPFGELHCLEQVDDDSHNIIYLIFDWDSVQNARQFWTSAPGRAHVAAWKSVREPNFVYLRDRPIAGGVSG